MAGSPFSRSFTEYLAEFITGFVGGSATGLLTGFGGVFPVGFAGGIMYPKYGIGDHSCPS